MRSGAWNRSPKAIKPINEELKKEKPDLKHLNALLRSLEQQKGTIPAAKLNKKIGEINAIISKLDDGKTVFYKDIGKEFLDQNGGLSGDDHAGLPAPERQGLRHLGQGDQGRYREARQVVGIAGPRGSRGGQWLGKIVASGNSYG